LFMGLFLGLDIGPYILPTWGPLWTIFGQFGGAQRAPTSTKKQPKKPRFPVVSDQFS
jgi:hypothetical protein